MQRQDVQCNAGAHLHAAHQNQAAVLKVIDGRCGNGIRIF